MISLIDTTDIVANVNYPSNLKLVCDAFRMVIRELLKFNEALAEQQLMEFENEVENEYKKDEKVNLSKYLQMAQNHGGIPSS